MTSATNDAFGGHEGEETAHDVLAQALASELDRRAAIACRGGAERSAPDGDARPRSVRCRRHGCESLLGEHEIAQDAVARVRRADVQPAARPGHRPAGRGGPGSGGRRGAAHWAQEVLHELDRPWCGACTVSRSRRPGDPQPSAGSINRSVAEPTDIERNLPRSGRHSTEPGHCAGPARLERVLRTALRNTGDRLLEPSLADDPPCHVVDRLQPTSRVSSAASDVWGRGGGAARPAHGCQSSDQGALPVPRMVLELRMVKRCQRPSYVTGVANDSTDALDEPCHRAGAGAGLVGITEP